MAETLTYLNTARAHDHNTRKRRRAYIVSCLQRNYSIRRDGVPDIPFEERKRLADLVFGAGKLFALDNEAHTIIYTRILADLQRNSPNLYLGDWQEVWAFHLNTNTEAPYTGTVDDTAVFTPEQIRDNALFLHEDKRRKYGSSDTTASTQPNAAAVRVQEQPNAAPDQFLNQISPGLFDAAYSSTHRAPAANHSSTYGSGGAAYGSRHLPPPAGLTDYHTNSAPSWGRSSSGGALGWQHGGGGGGGGVVGGASRQNSGSSHDLNLAPHQSLQDDYDDTSLGLDHGGGYL